MESVEERARLSSSMLEGLNAFHEAGFVHGVVAPSNFLMGDDGEPRLHVNACGFSSAVVLNRSASAPATKLTNAMAGTLATCRLRSSAGAG